MLVFVLLIVDIVYALISRPHYNDNRTCDRQTDSERLRYVYHHDADYNITRYEAIAVDRFCPLQLAQNFVTA